MFIDISSICMNIIFITTTAWGPLLQKQPLTFVAPEATTHATTDYYIYHGNCMGPSAPEATTDVRCISGCFWSNERQWLLLEQPLTIIFITATAWGPLL
jgi:hypothetical protein